MKVKLSRVFGLQATLDKLKNMPSGKTGFKVARFLRPVLEIVQDIEVQRNGLVTKFGDSPNEQGQIHVKSENLEAFVKALNDMLDQEAELVVEPIKAEFLESAPLDVNDLLLLGDLVIE